MMRKQPFRGRDPIRNRADLPTELIRHILSFLTLHERLHLATVSKAWSCSVRDSVRGVAVDLRLKTRDCVGGCPSLSPSVGCLALVSSAAAAMAGSAAAAATLAACFEPEEARLWQQGRNVLRPAAAAWHLRRAIAALGGRAGSAPRSRSLTLLLVAPEMDTSASELHRMLAAAGAEVQVAAVAMPQGLLRLDGGLNRQLTSANAAAAGLPASLQACAPYERLERLVLKLSPSDDMPAVLGCIRPATLPALRWLALMAPSAAGAGADMSDLRHKGLRRLDLHGVQLPAGFSSLEQLTGLERLAVRYEEEDEAPPLNLHGDLSALSALRQLRCLAVDKLGSGDGLPCLAQLTSLEVAPHQGARITLRALPRLRRLSVDLSSGSCGRELLSEERSTVFVPPACHGLSSLRQLELRCFVWRHWEAGGSDPGHPAGVAGSGSSGSSSSNGSDSSSETSGSTSEASDAASSDASSEAASSSDGTSSGASSIAESASASGSEEGLDMLGEGWEEGEAAVEAAAQDEPPAAAMEVDEDEEAPGLLDATWGFLQQHTAASSGGEHGQQVHTMASLEQRYIAALLVRLPSLDTVQLTDYMGLVDPASLPDQAQQGAKLSGAALVPVAAAAAAGKDGAAGSRAGSPGLVLQQRAGGAASSVAGWRRAVEETPVPGGISQYDVTYTRTA